MSCPHCTARRQETRERIHELWHEGLSLDQIATETGRPKGSVAAEASRMRAEGWDMPYRLPPRSAPLAVTRVLRANQCPSCFTTLRDPSLPCGLCALDGEELAA